MIARLVRRTAPTHQVRFGSRRCENSGIELAYGFSVPISSFWKSIALESFVRSKQLRKQFCASPAQVRFHTAGSIASSRPCAARFRRVGHRVKPGEAIEGLPALSRL